METGRYYLHSVTYYRILTSPNPVVRTEVEYSFDEETKSCEQESFTQELSYDYPLPEPMPAEEWDDEFTTAMLISYTEYPEWPEELEWAATGANAAWMSGAGETSITYGIKKSRYRFRFYPPVTGYIKIWVKKTFLPWEGEGVSSSVFSVEWEGSIPDPNLSFNHDANNIVLEDDSFIVEAPETEGVYHLELFKYSLIEDYEPADPDPETGIQPYNMPNGYPYLGPEL
ncbi:MAG: hypothetical protein IAE97_13655 [Chthoniobacterales bacterium]|nr:hypothetical protein [Chthoniobacterales bacterium]